MRPSTFRRCGAALLLALFVPSCTDAPTLPRPSESGTPGAAISPRGAVPALPPEGGGGGLTEHRRQRGEIDLRLLVDAQGRLHHVVARKAGKPAVHLKWHYRGDGRIERVSATYYLPDGGTRTVPSVGESISRGAASALLAAPATASTLQPAASCWWEWLYLLDLVFALIYAQLAEDWELASSLTLAVMKASWDLAWCLNSDGDQM